MRPVSRASTVEQTSGCDTSASLRAPKRRRSEGSSDASTALAKRSKSGRTSKPAPRGNRLISVGGGPRATAAFQAEVDTIRKFFEHFQHIESRGGRYDIHTVIVERRDEQAIGRGNAWGTGQGHGTVNTGPEGGQGLLDYASRLSAYVEKNADRLRGEAGGHPVLEALLEAPLDRRVLTRAEQGREELERFQRTCEEIKTGMPFVRLDVLTNTSVDSIDIRDPDRPKVVLRDARSGEPRGEMSADTVRLNTGTTLQSPITDPAVIPHAFVQAMDPQALKHFLESKQLLDDAGQLKPGVKLALGGTGLSAYDALLALQDVMPVFVRDGGPLGYRVDDEAARKYAGAITFISNTPGKWVPPRHAHDPAWRQQTDPLGSIEEQHALFLHQQGEEVFKSWALLVDASIAIAHGVLPDEVRRPGMSTPQLLKAQQAASHTRAAKLLEAKGLQGDAKRRVLDEATQTLDGACRQADLATILGLGMERDPGAAVRRMETLAPSTFAGRSGYLVHRAQLKGISEPQTPVAKDNAALLKRFETMMAHITASPMQVHAAAGLLFDAGIARYLAGSYAEFRAGSGASPLSFRAADETQAGFDAVIVSPVFSRTAESALGSLGGQVLPADEDLPSLGQVAANRKVLDRRGRPTSVEDYSLNGKGAAPPGSRSKVNVFATDVNNRESAVDVTPGLALRRMAQAHLAAAGFDDPLGEVERLYLAHLPAEKDHGDEVARFAPHFDRAMNKAVLVDVARQGVDGDAQVFKSLADSAATRSGSSVKMRAALFDAPFRADVRKDPTVDPQELRRHRVLSRHYADALAQKPVFDPAGRLPYHQRFVDMPFDVHQKVYQAAYEMAVDRLSA